MVNVGRPAKFSTDQILDAARDAAVDHWRDTTIAHVADRVGAPVGSIYHRFVSRDVLFGTLWARSVRRFHEGLLVAGQIQDPHASLAAMSRHVPEFCRTNPGDAKAMTLYRLPDLLQKVPPDLQAGLSEINDDVNTSLRRVTQARYGQDTDHHYRLSLVATRQCPYGLIRPLIGGDIPEEFDAICAAATHGILALGDHPPT